MKHETCPRCDHGNLGDSWYGPRLLRQHCNHCGWQGEKRVPEQQEVSVVKVVPVGQFGNFEFTVFDRYGHVMMYSRSYSTEKEAEEELQSVMKRSPIDEHCGPYTAVLWPARVEIVGKLFKGATHATPEA